MHSQFHEKEGFSVTIHPFLARQCGLASGDQAIVETMYGQLVAQVTVAEDIHSETVMLPEGTTSEGLGVNQLIVGKCSDLGESSSYYNMCCRIYSKQTTKLVTR